MLTIRDCHGNKLLSLEIGKGSRRVFSLMKDDYISLKFSLAEPIRFGIGSYVMVDGFGRFELTDLYQPKQNSKTGGWDYDIRFDAHYIKWKNKIFKYTPENASGEASWNLTAALDVHLGIFLRNLTALGYDYNGTPYTFDIDNTVSNTARLVTYENKNLLDSLYEMADKFECEVWVTDSIIHFGRCEFGDAIEFRQDRNVESMTPEGNRATYATRIYAFGSERNLPKDYRPTAPNITVNGVVQRRLMLPVDTPYIDSSAGLATVEAVEQVVIFDDVYPRTKSAIVLAEPKQYDEVDENNEPTGETWNAYRFTIPNFEFKEDYILPTTDLQVIFQTGSLAGMTFGVKFNPESKSESDPSCQLWEIIRNEDYGRPLPDDTLKPADGNEIILIGWDSTKISSLGLVAEAEQELKQRAIEKSEQLKIDPANYRCKMISAAMFDNGGIWHPYTIGSRVTLINQGCFDGGERASRIIGYEYDLSQPFNSPIYIVGEKANNSRTKELESKVESLTLAGQTYTGGNGRGVYIIRTNDSTAPTDANVYSALRTRRDFLSRVADDVALGRITFAQGAVLMGVSTVEQAMEFGRFAAGTSGAFMGMTPAGSAAEVDFIKVRKKAQFETLEIAEVKTIGGKLVVSPGDGVELTAVEDDGDGWICRYRVSETQPDGTERKIEGKFQEGDQIYCKLTNARQGDNSLVNRYWWRLCTAVGEGWFRVSATDCDGGSDAPQAGDRCAQLGSRTDLTRQSAIVLSTAELTASPLLALYGGIDSYSLEGKDCVTMGSDPQGVPMMNVYGQMYVGPRDQSTYIRYTPQSGVEVKARLSIESTVGDDSLADYIAANSSTDMDAINALIDAAKADLQAQIDGAIETWYYEGEPTLANAPASGWSTAAEKDGHIGDLYYDKASGYAYRFLKEDGVYKWVRIADTDITAALAAAAEAQETADGKMTVFAAQPTPPYQIGDIWVNATYGTTYDNDILRCTTAKGKGGSFAISDWTLASRYTDDSALASFISGSYADDIAGITGQLDQKSETWYQSADPSAQWSDNATKELHLGDIWYNTTADENGNYHTYIYRKANGSYGWVEVNGVPKDVFDMADGKASIYVSQPSSYKKNDLWILEMDYTLFNNVSYSSGTIVIALQDSDTWDASHWTKRDRYTDDTVANAAASAAQAAQEAADRIASWAEDGVISPVEMQQVEDEIRRIESDHTTIEAQCASYGIKATATLRSDYNTAYTAYHDDLTAITTAQPDDNGNVAIPQDMATHSAAYYQTRAAILTEIAAKAKAHVDAVDTKYAYLKEALADRTTIEGGLILTSTILLGKDNVDSDTQQVNAGINGIPNDGAVGGGIAAFYGGDMHDLAKYYTWNESTGWTRNNVAMPEDTRIAKGLDRFDGTGYRAGGNLWWDADGKVHADPTSFFVGEKTMGNSLAMFDFLPSASSEWGSITAAIPQKPLRHITVGEGLGERFSGVRIDYDADKGALHIHGNVYADGFVSALGSSSGGGSGSGEGSGGGMDESALVDWMQQHISEYLPDHSGLATEQWVGDNYVEASLYNQNVQTTNQAISDINEAFSAINGNFSSIQSGFNQLVTDMSGLLPKSGGALDAAVVSGGSMAGGFLGFKDASEQANGTEDTKAKMLLHPDIGLVMHKDENSWVAVTDDGFIPYNEAGGAPTMDLGRNGNRWRELHVKDIICNGVRVERKDYGFIRTAITEVDGRKRYRIHFGNDDHYIEYEEGRGFHFSHGLYSEGFVTAYGNDNGEGSAIDIPQVVDNGDGTITISVGGWSVTVWDTTADIPIENVDGLDERLTEDEGRIDEVEDEQQTQGQSIATLRQQIGEHAQRFVDLGQRVDGAEAGLGRVGADLMTKADQSDVDDLGSSLDELRTVVGGHTTDIAGLRVGLGTAQDEINAAKAALGTKANSSDLDAKADKSGLTLYKSVSVSGKNALRVVTDVPKSYAGSVRIHIMGTVDGEQIDTMVVAVRTPSGANAAAKWAGSTLSNTGYDISKVTLTTAAEGGTDYIAFAVKKADGYGNAKMLLVNVQTDEADGNTGTHVLKTYYDAAETTDKRELASRRHVWASELPTKVSDLQNDTIPIVKVEGGVLKIDGAEQGLSWSKITNRPTTVSGYGIADLSISSSGKITIGGSSVTPITSHQDLSSYATQSWVTGKGYLTSHQAITVDDGMIKVGGVDLIKPYAGTYVPTAAQVGARPSDWMPTAADVGVTLSNGKITIGNSSITPITSHQSLSGYATQTWVTGKGYATESWVSGKGYLTSHQSLAGYAKTSDVNTMLGGYYSKTDANSRFLRGYGATKYRIDRKGGGEDRAWKRIVTFSNPSSSVAQYDAVQVVGTIWYELGNHYQDRMLEIKFDASFYAFQNSTTAKNTQVLDLSANCEYDIIRIVKNSTNNWELQVRQHQNYTCLTIEYSVSRHTGGSGGTLAAGLWEAGAAPAANANVVADYTTCTHKNETIDWSSVKNKSLKKFTVGGITFDPLGSEDKSLPIDIDTSTGKITIGSKNITPLTSHQDLSSYATQDWVTGKGYLTSHQSITVADGMIKVGGVDLIKPYAGAYVPTAAQVGARPSSWMPTAADVGARPSSWTPTAADVGVTLSNGKITIGNSSITPITSHQSLSGYATQTWVTGKGYATESWVSGKGYLTSHQSLADYAKTSDLSSYALKSAHDDLAADVALIKAGAGLSKPSGSTGYTNTTFVKKTGDTMSGNLTMGSNHIEGASGVTMFAYKPTSDSMTGVSNAQWGLGSTTCQGVIRSSDTDLIHYRKGDTASNAMSAVILDSSNWSTYCAAASHTHSYLPLSGGTLSGLVTANAGIKVQGRVYGTGDDEGIVITEADNGWCTLALGSNTGRRSSITWKYSDTTEIPLWRYHDGTNPYDAYHPGKTGTLAVTSDLSAYLPLSGGTLSGSLTMNAAIIVHGSNTENNTRLITSDNSKNIYFSIGGIASLVVKDTEVRRGASAASVTLGTSDYPWNGVYATADRGTANNGSGFVIPSAGRIGGNVSGLLGAYAIGNLYLRFGCGSDYSNTDNGLVLSSSGSTLSSMLTVSNKIHINSPAGTDGMIYCQLNGGTQIGFGVGTSTKRGIYDTSKGWLIYTDGTNTILPTLNVGIGTTSPSYKLHVAGTLYASGAASVGGALDVTNGITSTGLTVNGAASLNQNVTIHDTLTVSTATNTAQKVIVAAGGLVATGQVSGATLKATDFISIDHSGKGDNVGDGWGLSLYNNTTSGCPTWGIFMGKSATYGGHGSVTTGGAYAMYFTINGTHLNSSQRGWVFQNRAYPNGTSTKVQNVFSISGLGNMRVSGSAYVVGTAYIGGATTMDANLQVNGRIDCDDEIWSTTGVKSSGYVTALSDERLKEGFTDACPDTADVAALPAVEFSWRRDGRRDMGSIAQAMVSVLPLCVHKDKDGWLSIDYGKAATMCAISVARKSTEHERRIAALERQINELQHELETLKTQ